MPGETAACPGPEGPGLQPPDSGRPSPALIARADPRYARRGAAQASDADTAGHDQDNDAAGAR
ncbi:hypothetical protein ACFWPV_26035 [Streptomyces uncialis]|uniref:hypothetical protein n=1 Tax=Streptomyces uncialis TaxID=1048205 RepID=UPI003657E586